MYSYERFTAWYGGHKAKHLSPTSGEVGYKVVVQFRMASNAAKPARGCVRSKMRAAVGGADGGEGARPHRPTGAQAQ